MTVHYSPSTGPQPPYLAPLPQPAYNAPLHAGVHSLANYAPPPLPPEPTPGTGRIFTPYVAIWSALGTVAVLCLGYAILADSPETHLSASDPRYASTIANDLSGLKDSVSEVRMELSKLKTDLAGQDAQGRLLSAQLTALERKITGHGDKASIQVNAAVSPPSDDTARAARKTAPAELADVGATPASPQRPRLVNVDGNTQPFDTAALETGSVAAAAKPAAKAADKAAAKPAVDVPAEAVDFSDVVVKPATPAAKPVGVQISSGASVDSLRLSWSLMADRHIDALKNLEPRFVARGDEAAPTFDLIAGPIKSRADAQKVCKALAAKNVPCKVGDFTGESL